MRSIVLDTETTGLEWRQGHRVIEIGCVEVVSRKLTGRRFHRYINPEREIDAGAAAVHGITSEFLQDKPKFVDVFKEFLDFVSGAELIIHNAPFDMGFLEHEFSLLGQGNLTSQITGVVDTLKLAKELNPGRKASLDALCERFEIDNAHRTLHGALLDAELLAEVYLAMTRGQETLMIDLAEPVAVRDELGSLIERAALRVMPATEAELAAHQATLEGIQKESKGKCVWLESPQ
ncbi:MAG: polymerase subunit epsilon [Pseudomonadota bacterium]|jgi:DNA polymerase-3 subunit epsilon